MPCYSGGGCRSDYVTPFMDKADAIMCALLTTLEKDGTLSSALSACDWNEAGVDRKFVEKWWAQHKRDDRRRRKHEEASRKEREHRSALRASAKAKLTPEERRALLDDQDDDL